MTTHDKYIHGCWVTGADRVCEDGTKGCARRHPLRGEPRCGKPAGFGTTCRRVPNHSGACITDEVTHIDGPTE